MERIGKLLCLILAFLMLFGVFAGCGGKKETDGSAPQETPEPAEPSPVVEETEVPEKEKITFPLAETLELTIALPIAPFANALITELYDWTLFKEMEKITNVHWEGQLHPALHATDTFSMMITSGDWPDVMANLDMVTKNGNYQCCKDEVIIELTDLVKEYAPHVWELIASDTDLALNLMYEAEDGENILLNFPMVNEIPSTNQESGLQYRGDWLDELGMEVPETISEFEAVLEAFKVNYNSMYYIGNTYDGLPISSAFNVRINYDEIAAEGVGFPLYVRDGKVVCGLLQDEFLEYLTLANKWYKAGYIHPDFYTGISANIDAEPGRIESGEFGAYTAGLSTFSFINDTFKENGSGAYMVAGPYLMNDNRDQRHLDAVRHKMRNRCWTISTKCQYPEIVCAWVDYLFTDEGYILYNYGVERTLLLQRKGRAHPQ
jgi:putative aldouronate transport system substrate-binding protein